MARTLVKMVGDMGNNISKFQKKKIYISKMTGAQSTRRNEDV